MSVISEHKTTSIHACIHALGHKATRAIVTLRIQQSYKTVNVEILHKFQIEAVPL